MESAPGRQTTGAGHYMIMVTKEVSIRWWILDYRKRDVGAHFGHPGLQGCTTIHQLSVGKSGVSMSFVHKSVGACAFEWDLRAKVGDSKGILLPIQSILSLCKQHVHLRVHFGASEISFWNPFGAPGAPWLHNDTSVF